MTFSGYGRSNRADRLEEPREELLREELLRKCEELLEELQKFVGKLLGASLRASTAWFLVPSQMPMK